MGTMFAGIVNTGITCESLIPQSLRIMIYYDYSMLGLALPWQAQ
jgi:hypothetical protein